MEKCVKIMRFIFLILIGLFSGIFAGMGMGGGTFLVPLLSICFGVSQDICQSINVLCCLCLAFVVVAIYIKKKLIVFDVAFWVGLPAFLFAGLGCFFMIKIGSKVMRIFFAVFIIILGIITFCRNVKHVTRL